MVFYSETIGFFECIILSTILKNEIIRVSDT